MLGHRQRSQVLSVKLSAPAGSDRFQCGHIELQGNGMRHRIVPLDDERNLEAALTPSFAIYIRTKLACVDGTTMVLSDINAEFRTETLHLRELQVLRTVRPDGTQRAVLRFLQVQGDVQSLLLDPLTPTQAETKAIALEAIEGVVGRTYDVARVYETVRGFSEPQGQFDHCTREIMSKREELLFRLDLLQRAVEGYDPKRPGDDKPDWLSLVSA